MLAAVANFASLGCGVKSMPIPPEAARPEQILDLEAATAKNGIRLTWGRPDNYAGGQKMRDLAGFTVSRSEADGPYRKIIDIPVTDQDTSSSSALSLTWTARPNWARAIDTK